MKQDRQVSRREVIAGVSAAAAAVVMFPKLISAPADPESEFVVVSGWVLKRSETA